MSVATDLAKFKTILIENGYKVQGFGYKKTKNSYDHFVTLFDEGEVQFYSYIDEDGEDYLYTTGMIKPNPEEFTVIMNVLLNKGA